MSILSYAHECESRFTVTKLTLIDSDLQSHSLTHQVDHHIDESAFIYYIGTKVSNT